MIDHETIEHDPALRRGLYSLLELTRFLSLDQEQSMPPTTVARWAATLARAEHRPRRPDYSFVDLISLLVVRNLVKLGMRLQDVHDAETFLRGRYGLTHPFASMKLKTDGVDVFYEALPEVTHQLTAANREGQEVIRPAIEGALKNVGYEDELAVEWEPVTGIVLDPRVQFGEPCIAGTAVTTNQVAEAARTLGEDHDEIGAMYRIAEEDVERALDFERRLIAAVA